MDIHQSQPCPAKACQQSALAIASNSNNDNVTAGAGSSGSGGPLPFWRHKSPPRLVLVSDLDHTMVQNEDPRHTHLLTFNATWHCHNVNTDDDDDDADDGAFAASGGSRHGTPCHHRNLLVYSTGRSPRLYRELWEEAPLLTPHVLICSVGTEIFYLVHRGERHEGDDAAAGGGGGGGGDGGAVASAGDGRPRQYWRYEPDAEWEALLDEGWDRQRVLGVAARFPELRRQVGSEQRRHKLSFHLEAPPPPDKAAAEAEPVPPAAAAAAAAPTEGEAAAAPPGSVGRSEAAVEAPAAPEDAAGTTMTADRPAAAPRRQPQEVLRQLQDDLRREGLRIKVVYSGGRDVDLLAEGAGKGAALRFLLDRMRRAGCEPTNGVQVNGDSGNDIELFEVPGVCGCVVANAFPELRDFAARRQQLQQQQQRKAPEQSAAAARVSPSGRRECGVFLASAPCAGGILQALRHFNFLPPAQLPALQQQQQQQEPSRGAGTDGSSFSVRGLVAAVHLRLAGRDGGAAGGQSSGGDDDVGAAAAAAAAAGVWVDEVEVYDMSNSDGGGAVPLVTAAGSAAAAAPESAREVQWVVSFKAYHLLSNGRRDLSRMARMKLVFGGGGGGGDDDDGTGGLAGAVILVAEGSFGLGDVPLPPDA